MSVKKTGQIALIFGLVTATSASFEAHAECPSLWSRLPDQVSFFQQESPSSYALSTSCMASLNLIPTREGLVKIAAKNYRTYTFDRSGEFSIFVSTEDSPKISLSTGQRSFFLFPRKESRGSTELFINTENSPQATFISFYGTQAIFNLNQYSLESLTGFNVQFSPVSSLKNNGGVELTPQKGYALLDFGWAMGTSPVASKLINAKSSKLVDGYGHTCLIANTKLIDINEISHDSEFKFKTDEEFKVFAKKVCPQVVMP